MTTHTAITKAITPDASEALRFFEAKNAFTTGPVEVSYMQKDGLKDFQLVDVRAQSDYAKAHAPGAVSLPRDRWEDPQGLSKEKRVILYCYNITCHLAAKAAVELAGQGFLVMEMEGGFEAWQARGLPVER